MRAGTTRSATPAEPPSGLSVPAEPLVLPFGPQGLQERGHRSPWAAGGWWLREVAERGWTAASCPPEGAGAGGAHPKGQDLPTRPGSRVVLPPLALPAGPDPTWWSQGTCLWGIRQPRATRVGERGQDVASVSG